MFRRLKSKVHGAGLSGTSLLPSHVLVSLKRKKLFGKENSPEFSLGQTFKRKEIDEKILEPVN